MTDKLAETGGAPQGPESPGPYIRLIDVPELHWLPTSSRATVRGWAYKGVRGIKLRTTMLGGVRYTTALWLREFFAALNASPSPGGEDPPARTPSARLRDRERAKRELSDAGI